jgi:hypothetical protein
VSVGRFFAPSAEWPVRPHPLNARRGTARSREAACKVARIGGHLVAGSIGHHHHLGAARRTHSIAHHREAAQRVAARSMAQEAGRSTPYLTPIGGP